MTLIFRERPTKAELAEKQPSLAARARDLEFHSCMPDEALAKLLVEIDEFHAQISAQFLEHDEPWRENKLKWAGF